MLRLPWNAELGAPGYGDQRPRLIDVTVARELRHLKLGNHGAQAAAEARARRPARACRLTERRVAEDESWKPGPGLTGKIAMAAVRGGRSHLLALEPAPH